jgi:hypothetical protein
MDSEKQQLLALELDEYNRGKQKGKKKVASKKTKKKK